MECDLQGHQGHLSQSQVELEVGGFLMDLHNLVGGLEHEFYSSIYWEFHHPN